MEQLKPDENEMIEAIKRSGYLLESLISEYLNESGFFVEYNQVIVDPFTGKSREIDLTAEYHNWDRDRKHKCVSKLTLFLKLKIILHLSFY